MSGTSGDDKTPPSGGDQAPEDRPRRRLGPLQVVASVFAAALGVQSSRNRERDFRHGRPGVFIAAGILFTVVFIAVIVLVVNLVLRSAGA